MSRHLIALCALLAGVASAEDYVFSEPDQSDSVWLATADSDPFWMPAPECPDDFGPIVVEMPPHWEYRTLNIDCGKVVTPDPSEEIK